jgi:carbon monoxide dehydrogenase subunit G
MAGSPAEGFEATVVQKVGPVKATFKGAVTLSDIVEGQSLMLSGEGKGGAAGFAKGSANVTLSDQDGGTLLSYEVEAKVGGKLAQLGSRIIDGFAKKMADQFFENFRSAVEGPSDEETKEDTAEKKGWFKKIIG